MLILALGLHPRHDNDSGKEDAALYAAIPTGALVLEITVHRPTVHCNDIRSGLLLEPGLFKALAKLFAGAA